MEKTIIENYPADNLPPELREGLQPGARVTVTVEADTEDEGRLVPKLSDLMGSAKGAFATPEEADDFLHRLREEWD